MNDDKQDFNEFLDWAFQYIFDAMIKDGMSSMKNALKFVISQASLNGVKGWKK